jgi:DNA-binding GntR family transcriptional regulator
MDLGALDGAQVNSTKDLARLEDLAGRLACIQASDDQIRDIRRIHDEMMQRYAARDRLSYFKLNQSIHSAILKASGNEPLWPKN